MLYRVHLSWAGFALTTLVVIDTDYIGSYKSNYYMITTTTVPFSYKDNWYIRLEGGHWMFYLYYSYFQRNYWESI